MKVQQEQQTETYFRDKFLLYQTLAAITTPEEMKQFLQDLLTRSELIMLHRRWHISRMLTTGGSTREISFKAKVGSDTVVRISKKVLGGTGVLKKWLDSIASQEKKQEGSVSSSSSRIIKGKYAFGG